MDDDDEEKYEIEEGQGGAPDQTLESYSQKGTDDRALVDQQAKDYDEQKKKKRDEIARLKTQRLELSSKLTHKEHDLTQLEIAIRQDEYSETRDHVRTLREEGTASDSMTREEHATTEIAAINEGLDRTQREFDRGALIKEKNALKARVDELSRAISLLEHEILRS